MARWLERHRVKRRAGSSARLQYRRLARQWRREHRRLFVTVGAVVVALFVACAEWAQGSLAFYLGVCSGGFLALYVALLSSPPNWIENYQRGAWGEQRTAATLAPLLDSGWVIIHDLSRIRSNLDHVLIGPGGVFVLDTKNFRGTVRADRDTVEVAYAPGRPPDFVSDKLARAARAQAAALNETLRLRGHIRVWVSAAVVFWADFPQQRSATRDMIYLHGDQLVNWLREQPARLNAKQIDELAGFLRPGRRRRTGRRGTDQAIVGSPEAASLD